MQINRAFEKLTVKSLKRYAAYAVGGLALTAVVILAFTMETGTSSNSVTGSEKAVVVENVTLEQNK
ncbi:hypothetical protein COA23_20030 [Priestia megaterium]|uniref:hypothetical protein n=2 Tax=Priestia megaterium TaxID=1404 RepID=UPI0007627B80|nr:hypothetical protein [Priestia megaterium]KWU57862.1 hypothetical protein AWX17_24470 [Priestia megaterium]MDC7771000.1 hypothetical protein [Priestia megaterium]MED4052382.1 hypothetical protein [Priestia megaterium]PEU68184.1 hypothetical protein CN397_23890 [Priestia megaterium]PEZ12093.1 hypothetical protein CN330_08025 [Priestia megaterium]